MDEFKKKRLSLAILVFLSFLTVLLGYISFDLVFPDYPFSRKLYYAFQLFSMESGDRFYERGEVHSLMFVIIYNSARFLAIFTLIYTILLALVSVLRDRFFQTRVRRMHGHSILCGLGEVGNAIVRNCKDKHKLVIIENDPENENLEQYRKEGIKVITGNALDPEMLIKAGIEHASLLYALTGDDFSNLTVIRNAKTIFRNLRLNQKFKLAANIDSCNLKSAATKEICSKNDEVEPPLMHLLNAYYNYAIERSNAALSGNADPAKDKDWESLKKALLAYIPVDYPDRMNPDFEVKLFNINELSARYIFRRYAPDSFSPVTDPNSEPVHILFLGYSQMGEELLKLCIQNCQFINCKNTKITILYQEADLAEIKVLTKHKNISRLIDLQFLKLNPHHLTLSNLALNGLSSVKVIYICSEQDRYQASYSVKAREIFGQSVPIIRWFSKDVISGSSKSVTSNLYTIDILESVATEKNIMDEVIDYPAIAVHNRWLLRAINDYVNNVEKNILQQQDIQAPKLTLLPWHLLNEETRDDNRSVIEHNFIKIRSMGQPADPDHYIQPEKIKVDFSFLKDKQKVEQLAEMEHRRWMATKYYYDWDYNPNREDEQKLHNNLIGFDQLNEGTQEYDIKQIEELEEVWNLKIKV
jgi:hypothetical protein